MIRVSDSVHKWKIFTFISVYWLKTKTIIKVVAELNRRMDNCDLFVSFIHSFLACTTMSAVNDFRSCFCDVLKVLFYLYVVELWSGLLQRIGTSNIQTNSCIQQQAVQQQSLAGCLTYLPMLLVNFGRSCCMLYDRPRRHFSVTCLRDLFESIDNCVVIDFVKEICYYSILW